MNRPVIEPPTALWSYQSMSHKDTDGNESSVEYECPVDSCGYTSSNKHGVKVHFGQGHDDEIVRKILLEEIHRLCDELGRIPRRRDAHDHGRFDPTTYEKRFGGWNAALEAAGYSPTHRPDISDDELLDELHRLTDKLGRPPRKQDLSDHSKFSSWPYYTHFESWNSALERAGLEPGRRHNIPDEVLLDEIREMASEIGHPPSARLMYQKSSTDASLYQHRFGSWNDALKEAGLKPRSHEDWVLSGEDHDWWDGGAAPYPYGEGWTESKREMVRKRDGRECQHCGRPEREHLEIHGTKHAVHHIRKAREFNNSERRNHPDNLVTLCRFPPDGGDKSCHKVWENMSPLRPQTVSSGPND